MEAYAELNTWWPAQTAKHGGNQLRQQHRAVTQLLQDMQERSGTIHRGIIIIIAGASVKHNKGTGGVRFLQNEKSHRIKLSILPMVYENT